MKMREPKIGRKERIEIWLLCRTVLDCKDGLIKKSEAIAEFSKHSGLPPLMARMIFEPMFKESKAHLKSSYPDWIKPPEFEDCQSVAHAAGVPVRQVYDAALAAGIQGNFIDD